MSEYENDVAPEDAYGAPEVEAEVQTHRAADLPPVAPKRNYTVDPLVVATNKVRTTKKKLERIRSQHEKVAALSAGLQPLDEVQAEHDAAVAELNALL